MDDSASETDTQRFGRPIAVDPIPESSDPALPAFIARPPGAPVYYGFPILEDVNVDGFRLGMITDFESVLTDSGDGFVVAPDDSRAGLIWEVGSEQYFDMTLDFEPGPWGVWFVSLPFPMTSRENARRNLDALLPRLREQWNMWREQFSQEG